MLRGFLKFLTDLLDERQEEIERKQTLIEAVLSVISKGECWHEWSIAEIRQKLKKPTSIYDVEQALKVIMKKNPRVKIRKYVSYVYD